MDKVIAHFFSIALNNGDAPEWVQLTPVSKGDFVAKDGRRFTIADADALLAASPLPIGIDYDHATDLSAKGGFSAPAAGWIEQLATHGPANEPGIWGRVKWTPRGKQSVIDGEYRGLSPALLSAKGSNVVERIFRVGLTNDPALPVKNLFSTQEMVQAMTREQLCDMLGVPHNTTQSDLKAKAKGFGDRKRLASAIGLPETATDDDVVNAVDKFGVQNSTLNARVSRILEAAGLTGDLDETTTVALCAKLRSPSSTVAAGQNETALQKQVDDLQKQVALLTAQNAGRTAEAEVTAAIAAAKLTPAQKAWAIDYCTRDPQGFKAFIGAAPRIVAAGSSVAQIEVPDGELTAQEKKLCAMLGVKEESFKRERAELLTRMEGARQ